MYEPHPLFEPPTNRKVPIWRYLSFTKFVSLLDTRSLHFARADRLEDPLEGQWSRRTVQAVQNTVAQLAEKKEFESEEARENFTTKRSSQLISLPEKIRRSTYINAWHVGEHESAAMWKLYAGENNGVAIVGTFDSLIRGLNTCEEHKVYVGMVSYVDFEETLIPPGNTFAPFLYKRKSFEFESELRALVYDEIIAPELGLCVKVDLDQLIIRVQVSPKAADWFTELVQSVSRQYGCERPVHRSSLYDKPLA